MVPFPPRTWSRFTTCPQRERSYSRTQQLPALIGLWPHEVEDYSHPGTSRIVALLRKALRTERNRARAGQCSYDLNRHQSLLHALKAERERLKMLEKPLPGRFAACAAKPGRARAGGTLRLPVMQTGVASD